MPGSFRKENESVESHDRLYSEKTISFSHTRDYVFTGRYIFRLYGAGFFKLILIFDRVSK